MNRSQQLLLSSVKVSHELSKCLRSPAFAVKVPPWPRVDLHKFNERDTNQMYEIPDTVYARNALDLDFILVRVLGALEDFRYVVELPCGREDG